jgi:hypothetical protein
MRKHILYTILALLVAASAFASPPTWTVIPTNYNNSMTFTGVISLSGIESTDSNDIIGAFVGTECRGVVKPILLTSINRYLVFLVVFSNSSSGENLTFKVYDASNDVVINAIQTNSFASYTVIGEISTPFVWYDVMAAFPISGKVMYDNTAKTVVNNAKIVLKSNGISIDSVTTNSTGNYTFSQRQNGTYTITVTTTKPWGGVNSTDALLMQRHFAGIVTLVGNKKRAGDVNLSGTINSSDALLVKRRFATVISSFIMKDWIFDTDTIIINGSSVNRDIYGICAGDVNASYLPLAKSGIILKQEGIQAISKGQEFNLHIRNQDSLALGAISLAIDYPTNLVEIKAINSKAETLAGITTNVNNGKIYVAWTSLQPLVLGENDTLLTLRMKYIGDTTLIHQMTLNLDATSELADTLVNVISGVILSYPTLVIPVGIEQQVNENNFEISCFPNPFSNFTEINYQNVEGGKVKIEIIDPVGKSVKQYNFENQTKGNQKFILSSDGVSKGVYFCKITLETKSGTFYKTKKLVITD